MNQCMVDADCLGGSCINDSCQSAESEFTAVLLEIVPNIGVPNIGGLRFFIELDDLAQRQDLELPNISNFSGTVKGADIISELCVEDEQDEQADAAPDGSLPVRLSLLPRQRILGIAAAPFVTEVTPGSDSSYNFEIKAPSGDYDIYIEPLGAEGECVRPPYLVINRVLVPDAVLTVLDLPTPERLTMNIERESGASTLDGWLVSIVEQDSARRLSNIVELQAATKTEAGLQYKVDLAFSPVQGDDFTPATELVRLEPPAGEVAPTIFFQRSVVELFEDNAGVINGLGELGEPIKHYGSVRAASGVTEPLIPSKEDSSSLSSPKASSRASLTFVASKLSTVPDGVTAEFSQVIETDEQGDYEVDLLPGLYSVLVQPMSEGLAQVQFELEIAPELVEQSVKALELPARVNLAGDVVSFTGEPVNGASVLTIATPPNGQDILSSPILGGPATVVLRNSQAQTNETGDFEIFADPGTVDLVARSETGSGYPWAISVGFEIENDAFNLGSLRFSQPYLVDGLLRLSDSEPVQGALIRTYAYANKNGITSESRDGTRLVQLGESRVDESGAFQLYLPSSFE